MLPTALTCVPAVLLVTCTVTVQLAPGARVAPVSPSVGPLAAAATAPPGHVVAGPGVALFVIAAG